MTKLWNMAARPITEDDLQSYVDGQLDPHRRALVEAYLAINPDEAERIEAYRTQRIGMHVLFDRTADEAIPSNLVALERQLSRALRRRRWLRVSSRIAASFAALAIAAGAGWWTSQQQLLNSDPLLTFARGVARSGSLAGTPSQADAAPDDESRLVGWLAHNPVTPSMPLPNLQPLGFKLLGGRVVPTPAGPAVQLTYEDAQAQHLTLYVSAIRGARKTDFTYVQDGKSSLIYWSDGSFVYALDGVMAQDNLLSIAKAVGSDFTPPPEVPHAGTSTAPNVYPTDTDASMKPADPPATEDTAPQPQATAPQAPASGAAPADPTPPAVKGDGGPATPKKADETRT